MRDFFSKHKYHLLILVVLILLAGISRIYLKNSNFNLPAQAGFQNAKYEKNVQLNVNLKSEISNLQLSSTTSEQRPTSTSQVTGYRLQVTSTSPVIPYPEEKPQDLITFTVNGDTYALAFQENQTVYQFMQALYASSQKPFSFETKEYPGMGMFVESINGIKNDFTNNKYWIYYVNGQSAKIGISNYIIKQGDKIEWKYESTNF